VEVFAQGAVIWLGKDGVLRVSQIPCFRDSNMQRLKQICGVSLVSTGGNEGRVRHEGGDAFVEELPLVLGEEKQFCVDRRNNEGDAVVAANVQ